MGATISFLSRELQCKIRVVVVGQFFFFFGVFTCSRQTWMFDHPASLLLSVFSPECCASYLQFIWVIPTEMSKLYLEPSCLLELRVWRILNFSRSWCLSGHVSNTNDTSVRDTTTFKLLILNKRFGRDWSSRILSRAKSKCCVSVFASECQVHGHSEVLLQMRILLSLYLIIFH